MSKAEDLHPVNCPSCGAPIEVTGPQARCPFCGTLVERSAPEAAAPGTVVIEVPAMPSSLARRRSGCAGTLAVLGAVVLLAAVGLVVFFLAQNETPGGVLVPLSRSVQGTPVPVPADRPGPADLLVYTYDSTDKQNMLSFLDGASHTLRWDSPRLGNSAFQGRPVLGPGLVYLTDGTRLLALNRSDGQLAWQATLADSVQPTLCPDCLRLVGNSLVVLCQDGTLQSFDARTGQALWSKRLNETPRDLWVVGGQVAVLDEEQGSQPNVSLYFWNPATGELVRKITPGCPSHFGIEGLFSVYQGSVLVSSSGDALYCFYNLSPGCAQRWNPATGEQVWLTVGENEYFDRFTTPPMLIEDMIYASYDHYVLAVDPATGELRRLTDEEDYELTVLGGQEGVLVVSARRTRGSERYELWGLDAATGQRKWQYLFEDEDPIEAPGAWAGNAYAWQLSSRGLVLLHMFKEPRRLVLETLDPQTGQSGGQTNIDLGEDRSSWNSVVWSGDTAWVTTTKLHAVDLVSGKLLYTWP
jgi:outer membrane protein assembly factor BamB